jgi:hypothetical protein
MTIVKIDSFLGYVTTVFQLHRLCNFRILFDCDYVFGRVWKELVMACFKLFQHLLERTEDNLEPSVLVCGLRLNSGLLNANQEITWVLCCIQLSKEILHLALSQDHEFPSAVILDMDLAVIICYLEFVHLKTLLNNIEVLGEVWLENKPQPS